MSGYCRAAAAAGQFPPRGGEPPPADPALSPRWGGDPAPGPPSLQGGEPAPAAPRLLLPAEPRAAAPALLPPDSHDIPSCQGVSPTVIAAMYKTSHSSISSTQMGQNCDFLVVL